VRTSILVTVLSAVSAAGADVAGMWQASSTMPDGNKHESTLDLQVNNGRLTGKITSKRGTVAIDDGNVNGDQISFTVIRKGNGDELKVDFTGEVKGDTMKLKMQYRDHGPVEIVAKRAS
jgi:hypothetical protein